MAVVLLILIALSWVQAAGAVAQVATIELLGQVPADGAFAADGPFIYLAEDRDLVILDTTYPSAPRTIGRVGPFSFPIRDVATDGPIVYVATGAPGQAGMLHIILATGATLFHAGQTHITSAADAAEALRPLAGDGAALLLAIGLIGSGFLAVPVLTGSSGYAVAETCGWASGFSRKARDARGFYGVIAAGTLFGMLFNFLGINPIEALFWTAVLNGFLAPPLLVLVILVANDRRIMGPRTNGRWLNVVGWGTTIVMFSAAISLVVTWGR
jgi:hypothetical protein